MMPTCCSSSDVCGLFVASHDPFYKSRGSLNYILIFIRAFGQWTWLTMAEANKEWDKFVEKVLIWRHMTKSCCVFGAKLVGKWLKPSIFRAWLLRCLFGAPLVSIWWVTCKGWRAKLKLNFLRALYSWRLKITSLFSFVFIHASEI